MQIFTHSTYQRIIHIELAKIGHCVEFHLWSLISGRCKRIVDSFRFALSSHYDEVSRQPGTFLYLSQFLYKFRTKLHDQDVDSVCDMPTRRFISSWKFDVELVFGLPENLLLRLVRFVCVIYTESWTNVRKHADHFLVTEVFFWWFDLRT